MEKQSSIEKATVLCLTFARFSKIVFWGPPTTTDSLRGWWKEGMYPGAFGSLGMFFARSEFSD